MKVIIREDTKGLGKAGQVIEVNNGYAWNYLIPSHIVFPANQANQKILDENLRQASQKEALIKQKAVDFAQKIKKETFTIEVKAAEKGKIFGNVTNLQIANAINEKIKELDIKHDQVILNEPIKELGKHTIVLKLHADVQTELTVEVTAV